MKAVDITLLFQATHFFIAYFVLKKFVFAPSLHILQQQEDQEKKMKQYIHDAVVVNNQAQEKKSDRWVVIKSSLFKLIPSFRVNSESVRTHQITDIQDKELSDKQQTNMTDKIYNSLLDIKK